MMLTSDKIGVKRAFPRSATPLLPRAGYRARRVAAKASQQSECQEASRRNLLAALGILGSFAAVQPVQAATDLYEELKSITSSRSGSTSLMDSFKSTRDAVETAAAKTNRGIRERLAAEATDTPNPSSSSSSSGGFKFSTPASPAKTSAPVAPKASSGSGFSLFGSSSGPKPQPPKPEAPKPQAPKLQVPKPAPVAKAAAAAVGGSSGGNALFPVIQAAGVLGLVGVGANAVTSFATSNKKGGKAQSTPAAAAAPTPGTSKVKDAIAKVQASNTAKISANRPASAQGTRSASRKVVAGAGTAASRTEKIVKKAPGAAAAATGTVRDSIKQALVNSEQPDEPTDFAVAGILGFTAVLGAFFIFGLPQPTVIEPEQSSQANDPLVELAKEEGFSAASRSSYKNPLFKSLKESDSAAGARRVIAAAPTVTEEPASAPAPASAAAKAAEAAKAAAAAAPKIEAPEVPKVEIPVPPKIEVPAPPKVEIPEVPKLEDAVPAPAAAVASKIADAVKPAPAAKTEAVETAAPAPAAAKVEAPKPPAAVTVAVQKAEEAKDAAAAPAAAAAKEAQQQGANPLVLGLAGVGVVVGALAVVGGNNSSSTEAASSTSTTASAAPTTAASSEGSAPKAGDSESASGAAAAETVGAAASTAAASAPGQGAPGDNE